MDEAVAEWVLGLLRPECVPAVCLARLDADVESESLVLLATEQSPVAQSDQVFRWFEQMLQDLEIRVPSPEAAAELLIEKAANAALSGEISPQSALNRIAGQIYNAPCGPESDSTFVGDALGLEGMYGLLQEYDEIGTRPGLTRRALDEAAKGEFREFLARSRRVTSDSSRRT